MKYEIIGEPTPAVICYLDTNEKMITERGSMVWMSDNMKMETSTGGLKKAFGRMFSGDSIFQNIYTSECRPGLIAFSSSFPGQIKAIEITPNRSVIVQKSAFLAAEENVGLSVFFQKKIGAGFFGGEGFVLQKLSGNGTAFVEFDGYAVEYNLKAGERMIVDTGNLAMMDESCTIEVQAVKGAKNILFGGEGIFNTVITGPGRIMLQTMPISNLAQALRPYFPTTTES